MKLQNGISQILWMGLLTLTPLTSWGWGKTGHCLVGSVAAQILAAEGGEMFEKHRFDLCYYNNVPDLIWKSPKTYELERSEHFFDLEPVLAALKEKDQSLHELSEDRAKISKEILAHGSAPWRVYELDHRLKSIAEGLKKNPKEKKELQGQWLLTAGVLGHYIADLAQPLHCTANYDGQLSGQKGLHRFFEVKVMDELHPEVESRVLKKALSEWSKFAKANAAKSAFQLSLSLCRSSLERVPAVLKLDKATGRKDPKVYAKKAASLLEERLVLGALHLALIWKRSGGWEYDGEKFFYFEGAPKHIPPGSIKKTK